MSDVPLLTPLEIGSLTLPNRVAVAPMSRVSTRGDGVPTPAMARYFRAFAEGGFGLLLTDGTYFDHAHSQAYPDQPALVTDAHAEGWRAVVEQVHAAGGTIALQLMHAGALVQGNHHSDVAIAPSAVQPKGRMLRAYGGPGGAYALPRAMDLDDIAAVLDAVGIAAAKAQEIGFDAVEIHGANGYLFDQFLTGYTNLRTDDYGGTPARRARLLTEAIAAARTATGGDFPIGVRVSQLKVNDSEHRWASVEEARELLSAIGAASPAWVHVASEGGAWRETSFLAPGVSTTSLAREVTGVPVIANGGMDDAELATSLLREGHTDLVALGQGAIANPDWPRRLAEKRPFVPFDGAMLSPEVTVEHTERWRETAAVAAER
jgi:2,4-dienoyl-CoA reductase-like NADH-dependent reductase (Old Yellow Enzyme family)